MSMEYLKGELSRGNAQDQAYSEIVSAILKARGEDIPLPTNDAGIAKEVTLVEYKRFTEEAKDALLDEGYVINTLTGQSIASLRSAGRDFWSSWHNDYECFEAISSIQSEVAINPNKGKLWLPDSNYKTLSEQTEAISKFSDSLSKEIPGVRAIMGGIAEYCDLAFTHLDNTGENLFDVKHGYYGTRTNTPTFGDCVASVGIFNPRYGLVVYEWDANYGYDNLLAAPLVIPIETE